MKKQTLEWLADCIEFLLTEKKKETTNQNVKDEAQRLIGTRPKKR